MKEVRINISEMLQKVHEDVKKLVRGFSDVDLANFAMGQWVPQADILEGPEKFMILVDLPGLAPGTVDVTVLGRDIRIEGEKPSAKDDGEVQALAAERKAGVFSRTFAIPSGGNPDEVTATLRDGLLELVIPKRADSMRKEVKIEVK